MAFSTPAHTIPRWTVVGMEGMWVKMFDPSKHSPPTPDMMAPTNPVPEVLEAAGLYDPPTTPNTIQRDLLNGLIITTWDGLKDLHFMTIRDKDNPASSGEYPGSTLRLPRGVVFHAESQGKGPPPHTIHWHGHEPTPANDGVGHCSFEIGSYTYQWQPNFIGTYFHHCHRNTVQHFDMGLFGLTIVEPPDAYFATQQNPAVPIGHCRDGKRRTAANLTDFPQFPGFKGGAIDAPDPLGQYPVDPHAMTVAYDVEALWVPDDRDSVWSDLAQNARQTYPAAGTVPGVNDNFHTHAGDPALPGDFFAFNDFNPDYWFVTGVAVPAPRGGTGTIPSGITIPATMNSGVAGSQVSINATVGDTILIRCLDAAYNCLEVTFPVDVVIIEWDGRALGVGPYGQYNHPYVVPAGEVIHESVARRFSALVRFDAPFDGTAEIKFIDTRGHLPGTSHPKPVLNTALIPIHIEAAPPLRVTDPVLAGSHQVGSTVPLEWTMTPTVAEGVFHAYAYAADGTYHWLSTTPATAGKTVYTYDWTVTQPAGTGYKIRVWYVDAVGNWLNVADSPSTFAITAGGLPQPTVTQPATGGPFTQGTVVPVEWTLATAANTGVFHAYALGADGTYHWLDSQNATAGKTLYTYNWTVTQAPATGYKVRVWYVDGSGNWLFFGDSPSAFEILAGSLPQPTVTRPSTAGPFAQGAVVPVEWTLASAASVGVFHAYALGAGGTYSWIRSLPANAGQTLYSFDWTVTQAAATGYKIRVWYVDGAGNWLYFGDSSPAFEITGAALPQPTVTGPNSGGSFATGQVVPVTWDVSPAASAGLLHAYAYSSGGTYYWLNTQSAAGQTSYTFDWSVAQPPGAGYVIRVWYVDAAGNWLSFDDSDVSFLITSP